MSPREALRSALASLGSHKLRSVLSMLGMIFGVGAVIAMLSIGAGAEREAMRMIERLGLRNLIVRAVDLRPPELEEARKKSPGLAPRDVEALGQALPGVAAIDSRVKVRARKVLAGRARTEAEVSGVSWRHAELVGLAVGEGRFLDPLDEARHAQVCVIGSSVRRDLFGHGEAVGGEVKVDDVWLEVVGVLDGPAGAGTFQGVAIGATDRGIYLPATTAARKFVHDPLASPYDELVVRLGDGVAAREAAVLARAVLDRLHGGARDYEVVVPEALLEQRRRTQRLFNVVMGSIAGISLLVGGIGIMNIMLATVLERTREVGVRRALGARRRDIRFQFIVEAFSISSLGGAAGVLMGVAIAGGVAAWAGMETVVTPASIAVSTGVSMAVGLASGIYPALRAARLDPIEALRYE